MRGFFKDYSNRVALMLAIGLILIVAHYSGQPFLKYFFVPQIGMAILLGVVLTVVASKWKSLTLGPKTIWIPLAVIAGSAVLRLVIQQDVDTLAGALFMSSMFGLYVISRQYGERALNFFMPVVIAGAVSVIIQAIVTKGGENAGIFSEYATAAQFLVFGWIVSPRKHQWWLASIVLMGLFCTGAEEAIFYVAILGVVILIRKDWGKKILLPIGILGIVILIATPFGLTQKLYSRGVDMVQSAYVALTDKTLSPVERDVLLDEATNGRWTNGWRLHRPVKPLGYGVNIAQHYKTIPHNIVLLVIDQLGPVAAMAWLAVMVGGLRKTKWAYGFVALILFGVFQPYVWTKMAPWMWAMTGTAATSQVSGYIFRDVVTQQL